MKPIMQFAREADLQEFMHQCLGGDREVKLSPACRIDLRTDHYDIEIKPYLTESAMDKAAGQIARYSPYSEGRQPVIAGCTPPSYSKATELLAESHRAAGVEVWFVDQIDLFQDAYLKLYGGDRATSSTQPINGYAYADTDYYEEEDKVNPLVFLFWGAIAVIALTVVNNQPPETARQSAPSANIATIEAGKVEVVETVNIRTGPSTEAPIITQARPGDILTATGRQATNTGGSALWIEIQGTDGERAWVVGGAVR